MKQKDLLLIIVIAIFAGVFSLLLSNLIFGGPKKHNAQVPVVDKITSDFVDTKDPKYSFFNSNALNPTVLIKIDNNSNTSPIGTSQGR